MAGSAQFLQLVDDHPAVFFLPLPNPLDELLSAQLMTVQAFARQLPLHHILGGDPRMVRARHPEAVMTLHPLETHEDIL